MVDDTATPNSAQSPVALDLDALAPKAAQISFKGKTIEVRALDLPDYAAFIELYNILSSLKADESDPTVVMPIYEKIRALVDTTIPELKEEKLTLPQLLAVFNLLIAANSASDKALMELADRGIEVKGGDENGDPKDSISSEPSPSSLEATPATE